MVKERAMDKLKMHSPNLTQENIARIRDLFPGCVTEAKGEDGSVKLAVDFDQLRQELSESIVEGPQERYHLNWPGKRLRYDSSSAAGYCNQIDFRDSIESLSKAKLSRRSLLKR